MDREILFRGFSKDVNMWVYGDFNRLPNENIVFLNSKSEIDCENIYTDSIGQFTGLTDKNGVKIFEGDIIRVCKNKNGAFVVVFKNQYVGGWVLEHSKGELSLGARKQDEIEVIGNVFEHPELMEV